MTYVGKSWSAPLKSSYHNNNSMLNSNLAVSNGIIALHCDNTAQAALTWEQLLFPLTTRPQSAPDICWDVFIASSRIYIGLLLLLQPLQPNVCLAGLTVRAK